MHPSTLWKVEYFECLPWGKQGSSCLCSTNIPRTPHSIHVCSMTSWFFLLFLTWLIMSNVTHVKVETSDTGWKPHCKHWVDVSVAVLETYRINTTQDFFPCSPKIWSRFNWPEIGCGKSGISPLVAPRMCPSPPFSSPPLPSLFLPCLAFPNRKRDIFLSFSSSSFIFPVCRVFWNAEA